MEADGWVPPEDDVAHRLRALEHRLRLQLEGSASVNHQSVVHADAVELVPNKPDCLSLWWLQDATEVLVEVGRGRWKGRWELLRDDAGVSFVEDAATAVVAGTAIQVLGPGRSFVRLPLSDGTYATSVRGGVRQLLPAPGWRRWGRAVAHEPYR